MCDKHVFCFEYYSVVTDEDYHFQTVYCTYPKRMKDPPARNRPASCVNFNPKWGSYTTRRIIT